MKIWTTRGYLDFPDTKTPAGIDSIDAALLIERCAKIADPWPESDGKSEVDEVRRKIAASIRSIRT